jgi:hypothetical protein
MAPFVRPSDRGSVLARRPTVKWPNPSVAVPDDDDEDFGMDTLSMTHSDGTREGNGDETSMEPWDLDDSQRRMKMFDEFANRTLLAEETDLMLKKFEAAEDVPFDRTYQRGRPVREFTQQVTKPYIGIVLLPGADLPEVNRLEQSSVLSKQPEQRDATWRVNTAGEM